MHLRKSKIILVYFFLFFLIGSINNKSLNNLELPKIEFINISGLDEFEKFSILKQVKNQKLNNIFFINKNKLKKIFDKNTLIENYNIFKVYPYGLNIEIIKTTFLAKINIEGQIYLIGTNGKLTKKYSGSNSLPFIFGKPDISEFLELRKIIDQSQFSFSQIKKLYFFPSRRWDLEIQDNILIKLPNYHIKDSLNYANEFLNNNKEIKFKTIDIRVKDQIILND